MKYIIIGGVAGGASTAARLRRLDENAEILLIEKGDYISYANCGLPYYIGEVIQERNKLLVQTTATFHTRFKVDVRPNTEAIRIDRQKKSVALMDLKSGEITIETYDKLVLAPGATAIIPPIPGINHPFIHTIRTVNDADNVKSSISKRSVQHATVIGAGFIGLEMIENLINLGIETTLIERSSQVLTPVDLPFAALVLEELKKKGVQTLLSTNVTAFQKDPYGKLNVLTETAAAIETDLVILSIGVKPYAELAINAGLTTGKSGGILVNEYMQTSDENIYAVGDVIEFENPISKIVVPTYLAGPANKQGRICANNLVFGNTESYKGSIQTAIVKIFDLTIGTSGMTEKQLIKENIPHTISTTFGGSNAGYFPGSEQVMIQIAFSPDDGTLLGAQVAGNKGIDKRIDVLSLLIQKKGSIYDLMEFEHAYAPQFSSAKDPLNMAGFVAENILQKRLELFYTKDLASLDESDFLLDVRSNEEFVDGVIPGAKNIPLDILRDNLDLLPKEKTIYLYCEAGLRGYLAQRILNQKGFSVKNLSGGYRLWKLITN